jgi:hypothetical protein
MILVVIKAFRKFVSLDIHPYTPFAPEIRGMMEKWNGGIMGLDKIITRFNTT